MQTIRLWLKSWFFSVENQNEYNYSKRFFHKWINDIRNDIGLNLCDAIVRWIKTSLEPFEQMWVNYIKNDVCAFECRTTSVAESMHSSMKFDYEGARSSFSLHKSATIVLDNFNRKQENTHRLNAVSVDSSRTYGDDNEGSYLTDYAYNKVTEELLLSKACRDIHLDKYTYLVYTPDIFIKKTDIYHQDSSGYVLSKLLLIVICVVHVSLETGTKSLVVMFYTL